MSITYRSNRFHYLQTAFVPVGDDPLEGTRICIERLMKEMENQECPLFIMVAPVNLDLAKLSKPGKSFLLSSSDGWHRIQEVKDDEAMDREEEFMCHICIPLERAMKLKEKLLGKGHFNKHGLSETDQKTEK